MPTEIERAVARRSSYDEKLEFVVLGSRSFQDRVLTINPDGKLVSSLLEPTRYRSFTSYSSRSLRGKGVVLVHEAVDHESIIERLYLYNPAGSKWEILLPEEIPKYQGTGVISPDQESVAFTLADKNFPVRHELWVKNLLTNHVTQLTQISQDSTWDSVLDWRPDGKAILFLRYARTKKGIASSLMEISLDRGQPASTDLFPESEAVFAAAYSPNAERLAILSRNGIEVVERSNGRRAVLVPRNRLGQYRSSGLSWSADGSMLAVAIYDPHKAEDEIVTIFVSTGCVQPIFAAGRGYVRHLSFIKAD